MLIIIFRRKCSPQNILATACAFCREGKKCVLLGKLGNWGRKIKDRAWLPPGENGLTQEPNRLSPPVTLGYKTNEMQYKNQSGRNYVSHTCVCTQWAGGWEVRFTASSSSPSCSSRPGLEHIENPPTTETPGIKKSTLKEKNRTLWVLISDLVNLESSAFPTSSSD